MLIESLKLKFKNPQQDMRHHSLLQTIHIDGILLFLLLLLSTAGLLILFSASSQNLHTIELQAAHLFFAFGIMLVFAQISHISLQRAAPWVYVAALLLLLIVEVMGHIGKGAQRWLSFGFVHFQPAELMKLAVPLLLASYYHKKHLPITFSSLFMPILIILTPALLVAKEPDLSTAILLTIAGCSVLFLAGLHIRFIASAFTLLIACLPFVWYILHDYQRQRVITFFNPEYEPLGKGYHIIQSKIAIGSGGVFGKGWLNGTQSNLHFLPERTTDFIFAICGEEFGLIGSLILIILYILIVLRGLYITIHAQNTFSRLMAGSITFTFFISFFINMGMVSGIFPVMGVPLPLVSYGGSSMVTIMASFGILMSIQTHRKLVTT